MGRVLVTATFESLSDLFKVHEGNLAPAQVRRLTIHDALVDTGATGLCMPKSLIDQLGLIPFTTKNVRTTNGPVVRSVYGTVRLTVQGRVHNFDVTELPEGCPVLIGQLPLEAFDFVVDPNSQSLIGNPRHGGIETWENY